MLPTTPDTYPIIDVHAHPVSRDLVRDARNLRLMERHAEALVATDAGTHLLNRMDVAGVARTCLMGPAHDEGCAHTNDTVRALVEAHPDRFVGFVGVDPFEHGQEHTRRLITTAIEAWKFKGVGEFFGDLSDPCCDVVYRSCMDLRVPLLIHCGAPLPSQRLKHGHPEGVDEIARKYPDLTIIAAHIGMPWIPETITVAVRHPNVYLDISALPAFNRTLVTAVLAICFGIGLEDRLLFGTDFPLVDPATYVKLLDTPSPVSPATLAQRMVGVPQMTAERRFKLMSGNAVRVLGQQ